MNNPIHFLVLRSRTGWAVNVEADLLSEHADLEDARRAANRLAELTRAEGCEVAVIDLSEQPQGALIGPEPPARPPFRSSGQPGAFRRA